MLERKRETLQQKDLQPIGESKQMLMSSHWRTSLLYQIAEQNEMSTTQITESAQDDNYHLLNTRTNLWKPVFTSKHQPNCIWCPGEV